MKEQQLIIITKKEILSFNPCNEAREYVEKKLGKDKEKVSIEFLHRIIKHKPNWVAWLMSYKAEWTKDLIELGADVHADNDYALRSASGNGRTEVVKLLLDAGANVHANNNYTLQWASYKGHTEVVKLLLDAGADVHANNNYALCWASRNGHTETVKVLEKHIEKLKKQKS